MNSTIRVGFHTLVLLVAVGSIAPSSRGQTPGALDAWAAYVESTERRINGETRNGEAWPSQVIDLWGTGLPDGGVRIEALEARDARGEEIDTPDSKVHHWRGAIFIPGVGIDALLDVVQNPERDVHLQEDVLEARVLDRSPNRLRVFLKLTRSKIVTAVYNTEHTVTYTNHGAGRVESRTEAVKIAELDDPGTPGEREKPRGEDRGFLWKLNSYWHYEEVEGGVLIQCESISLSRSIPFLVRPLVWPIVEGIARESLERTLVSLRDRLVGSAASDRRTEPLNP
jgi:hypothetical protein